MGDTLPFLAACAGEFEPTNIKKTENNPIAMKAAAKA
jgi:hypothetical protein